MVNSTKIAGKWPQIERWFDRLLDLPLSEAKRRLGDCSDPIVVSEVLALLESSRRESRSRPTLDWLEAGLGELAPDLLSLGEASLDRAGHRLGSYRLLEVLGRGGMGVVYRAERADGQFEQQVAIKILPQGLDIGTARERFLLERQILARLRHPGIADLLDGGVSPDGFPYLVMELIDGVPIDQYCEEHSVPLDERIQLFLQVCQAVDFAHRNMVVHRDIKPGNLLVSDTERGLVVKLLDFGIAKILDHDPSAAQLTRTGSSGPLTPNFAAPEQLLGEPVSAATDVYALGILLYKLLTGELPHEWGNGLLSARDIEQRAETTNKPSKALRESGARPAQIKRLHGDLDNITLTALQLAPARRYPTVQAFAADLRAYLNNRPVSAASNTWRYRTSRFVRRNTVAVATATGVILLTLAGIGLLVRQVNISEREREAAEEVADFSLGLLGLADVDQGERLDERKILDLARGELQERLSSNTPLRLRLLGQIAKGYGNLDSWPETIELLEEILRLYRAESDVQGTIETLANLAEALAAVGRVEECYEAMDESIGLSEGLGLNPSVEHADLLLARGYLAWILGSTPGNSMVDGALSLQSSAEMLRSLAPEGSAKEAQALHFLASLTSTLRSQGEPASARADELGLPKVPEAVARQALAMRREFTGPRSMATARSLNDIAMYLDTSGKVQEGLEMLVEAYDIYLENVGGQHPDALIMQANIAAFYRDLGHFAEAREIYEDNLRRRLVIEPTLGARHSATLYGLGFVSLNLGDAKGALARFDQLLALEDFKGWKRYATMMARSDAFVALGRNAEAEAGFLEAYDGFVQTYGSDSPKLVRWSNQIADFYQNVGRTGGASRFRRAP